MVSSPKISVVMSVYNEPIELLEKAINSILDQTFSDFEFIIINDNPSQKNNLEYLRNVNFSDSRIVLIENSINLGLAKSLNKGFEIARGELIARMDADDVSIHDRLEIQYNYLKNNDEISLLGSNLKYIDENDKLIGIGGKTISNTFLISQYLKYGNCFNHPTWMFRKKLLDDLVGYRDFPVAQDYDFITRLVAKGYLVKNLSDFLILYRIRNDSISRSKLTMQKRAGLLIQKLYKQRLKNQDDQYTVKTMEAYVESLDAKSRNILLITEDMSSRPIKILIKPIILLLSTEQRQYFKNSFMRSLIRFLNFI